MLEVDRDLASCWPRSQPRSPEPPPTRAERARGTSRGTLQKDLGVDRPVVPPGPSPDQDQKDESQRTQQDGTTRRMRDYTIIDPQDHQQSQEGPDEHCLLQPPQVDGETSDGVALDQLEVWTAGNREAERGGGIVQKDCHPGQRSQETHPQTDEKTREHTDLHLATCHQRTPLELPVSIYPLPFRFFVVSCEIASTLDLPAFATLGFGKKSPGVRLLPSRTPGQDQVQGNGTTLTC